MSASSKKKIRKEENAARMTERQRKAQKEAKALKIYSIVFVVLIAAVILSAALTFAYKYYDHSGWQNKHTIALTVGDHEINSVEMNYYYLDTINARYSQWSEEYGDSMLTMLSFYGLDLTQPLDQQEYDEDSTWADYFMDAAIQMATDNYILYDAAMADENFEMTSEQESTFTSTMGNIEMSAMMNGITDMDWFMSATYGNGANYESYYQYQRRSAVASAYYQYLNDSLTYTDADYREYEADKLGQFSSYTYGIYEVPYDSFLGEGTTADDGTVTHTDDQIEAAKAEAKKTADQLATAKTIEELDKAIAKLPINKDATTTVASTKQVDVLYSSVTAALQEWISNPERKANDTAVIEKNTTSYDEDGNEETSLESYYVVFFQSSNDNKVAMSDVRHLLVTPTSEDHEETGEEIITEEAWQIAKDHAEMHLNSWKEINGTEQDFIDMVIESSDDGGSAENGGLYANINRDSSYVPEFLEWAIDPARTVGETGIIKTEYGYHVMYYVGASALTYRDYMIDTTMRAEDLQAKYDELINAVTVAKGNTSLLNTSIALMSAT